MHASDSTEQREVEKVILKLLCKECKDVEPFTYIPDSNEKLSFQIDGYSKSTKTYFEFYAGLNTLKAGQKKKISCDVLKLITIEQILNEPINKCVVVIHDKIAKELESSSWLSKSIELFKIKVLYLDIGDAERLKIESAKKRQGESFL